MNLGFSGPIVAKEVVVLKERARIMVLGHLRRTKDPTDCLGIDGGIIETACV